MLRAHKRPNEAPYPYRLVRFFQADTVRLFPLTLKIYHSGPRSRSGHALLLPPKTTNLSIANPTETNTDTLRFHYRDPPYVRTEHFQKSTHPSSTARQTTSPVPSSSPLISTQYPPPHYPPPLNKPSALPPSPPPNPTLTNRPPTPTIKNTQQAPSKAVPLASNTPSKTITPAKDLERSGEGGGWRVETVCVGKVGRCLVTAS